MKKIALLILPLIFLSACESFTADRYVVNSSNQASLKSIGTSQKFSVGDFTPTSEEAMSVGCRLAGPIQVAGASDHAEYIQRAFQDELNSSSLYRQSASKVFTAEISKIYVSTVAPASWDISGTFYLNNRRLKSVSVSYPYKTSFSAMGACNNAAENFPYAVEEFIGRLVSSPEFKNAVR